MERKRMSVHGYEIEVISCNTIVVGSGAAGFNAADRLYGYGQRDIAMVTEHINAGTSRNTGSGKQTYYKLTLSGDEPDSVGEMAKTLFSGQCVDGDIALVEAALSSQCFLKLADLGVPFPTNRYGEYIGYKTDHDPRRRATSVGPLTSRQMTEALEKAVKAKDIPIFDGYQVISVLTADETVKGLLCLNLHEEADKAKRFTAFCCKNVIYATGGPAGMYADSVYPFGHYGASGIAFAAGVKGRNLTEWQYGLASIKPRWNVSGTYMQALPRFISTDRDGGDEREFLCDFFGDKGELLTKVFLKGYEWPFDVRKVESGSSIVDILVYIECCLKDRRVFLDFRSNPFGAESIDYAALRPEARSYLEKAGATFGTPLDRLLHMNAPAVDFYRDKGVDLAAEPLEIALCAQHNNGGLGIDLWWQTNVEGFFAVGEVAASHGVYRPGGSALNAGQVGSTRAARYIASNRAGGGDPPDVFAAVCKGEIARVIDLSEAVTGEDSNVLALWDEAQREMSRVGAAIRNTAEIERYLTALESKIENFQKLVKVDGVNQLRKAYRLYDMLICQYVYLGAMVDYARNDGKSRGSAMYYDADGTRYFDALPEMFRFVLDDGSRGNLIQEAVYNGRNCFSRREVRPLPDEDDFFENVWRAYRENGNVC